MKRIPSYGIPNIRTFGTFHTQMYKIVKSTSKLAGNIRLNQNCDLQPQFLICWVTIWKMVAILSLKLPETDFLRYNALNSYMI